MPPRARCGSSTSPGNAIERLCNLPDQGATVPFVTGAWNDDVIVFSIGPSGLYRVPATGGRVEPLTVLDKERRDNYHSWPQLLPGGRLLLFVRTEDAKTTGLYAGSVDRARAHRRAGDLVSRGVCRRSPAVDDGGPPRRAAVRRCHAEAVGNAGHARAGGVPGRRTHAGILGLGRRHARLCRRRQRIASSVPLGEPHRHFARRGRRCRKLRIVRFVAGWRPGGRRGPPRRLAAALDAGARRHDARGDECAHHGGALGYRSEIRSRRGRRVCPQQRRYARRPPRAHSRWPVRPSRIRAAARR